MEVICIILIVLLVLFFVGKWKQSPKQKGIVGENAIFDVFSMKTTCAKL